jgi:hypothetical protein
MRGSLRGTTWRATEFNRRFAMHSPMHLHECLPGSQAGSLSIQRRRNEMIRRLHLATCLVVVLACSACSTKPRTFSATVRPASAALAVNQSEVQTFATCDHLVRKGHKGNFASTAASGAAGTAGAFGGAGLAMTGLGGGTLSAAGATAAVAMPVIGIAAAFGMNRMIRSGREKKYRKNMSLCLGELGFDVVDWTRMKKKQPGTATLASPALAEPVDPEPATEITLTAS